MSLSAENEREFDLFITDLNGNLRGKRIPVNSLDKVMDEGVKLPRSVLGFDFWGMTYSIMASFLKPAIAMVCVCLSMMRW